MMIPSPTALAILADAAALGIDLAAQGDILRYRPPSKMTPALLDRLQRSKAELLTVLDSDGDLADLRRFVAALKDDNAWRQSCQDRFHTAKYANADSLLRVLGIVVGLAEDHHRRRDWIAFASACRYLHCLAAGTEWDNFPPIRDESAWEIALAR